MAKVFDPTTYDLAFRPNYEAYALAGWVIAAMTAAVSQANSALPLGPFYWLIGLCSMMALRWLPGTIRIARLRRGLRGRPATQITLRALYQKQVERPDSLWLGYGFAWEHRHTQRVFEILKRDPSRIVKQKDTSTLGQPWIHGVESHETQQYQHLSHTAGHTLILGTTGAGKTRLFDLLIAQAILRGEAVIILDPKGDHELCENARGICEAMGQPERFVYFHPAFPERSVRLDPLRHFGQVSEIASRLAALIPSETGSDPFKSFGWQALNNIAQGLVLVSKRPNLVRLRRFLEGGTASLVEQAIIAYGEKVLPDWQTRVRSWLERTRRSSQDKAMALTHFYYEAIQPLYPNPDLEGLLSMFQHDGTHFSKMVASLLPIMNMLTSGELGSLLSPDPHDPDDFRPITDTAKIARNGQVAYIGLNMLSNPVVGSAIGSLFLSDLAAVAGDRYNYEISHTSINLLIDEAADAINDPCIQLLNKGRGAGLRLWLATQTISDLIARLGNEHKAYQVLGNMNTRIALRILDQKTQEYMTLGHPKTRLNYVMCTQSQTVKGETPVLASSSQTEQLKEEEAELFPSALLGMLPNFEYLATLAGGQIIKGRVPILNVTDDDMAYFTKKRTEATH